MIRKVDLKIRVIAILLLVALCILYVFPLKKSLNLGLDLKGGMSVLLSADTSGLDSSKVQDAVSAAVEKIRTRIDAYGVKETSIQVQGSNSILVQVPGVVDREIIDKLKEVGKLEFKLVEDDKDKIVSVVKGEIPQGYEIGNLEGLPLILQKEAVLLGSDLAESSVGFDSYGLAQGY